MGAYTGIYGMGAYLRLVIYVHVWELILGLVIWGLYWASCGMGAYTQTLMAYEGL